METSLKRCDITLPAALTFGDFYTVVCRRLGIWLILERSIPHPDLYTIVPQQITPTELGQWMDGSLPSYHSMFGLVAIAYLKWTSPCYYGYKDLTDLEVYVRKDMQRRGLGGSMVKHFVALMYKYWAKSATHVGLEVLSSARGFWLKMGAKPVDDEVLLKQPHLQGYEYYMNLT